MYKKMSLILLFLLSFWGLLSIIQPTQKVEAASKSDYEVSPSSSLYDIADNSKEYKHGKAEALKKGEKTPKIVYDVYGANKSTYHKAPTVEYVNVGRGKEDVFTFTGWSVIHFYYDHKASNQKTYIAVDNHTTGKTKIYETKETSLSATSTLKYYGQSKWCSPKKFDEFDKDCNKKYESVGFKAYIPIEDLLDPDNPGRLVKFSMKIIKSVTRTDADGDKHTRTWWDDLTIPFFAYGSDKAGDDLANLNYTLDNLNSADLKRAQVNKSTVMRLTQPGGDVSSKYYFTMGYNYSILDQIERSDRTAVYFKVKSADDGGATRYAASPFWVYPAKASIFGLNPEPYMLYRKGYDKDRTTSSGTYKKIYDETDFDTAYTVLRYTTNYSYTPRKTDNSGKRFVNDQGNPLVPITSPVTGNYKKLATTSHKFVDGRGTYKVRVLPIYYKTESIVITQKHVDKETGDEIADQQKKRIKVGDSYSFSPKSSITANGKTYYPVTTAPQKGTAGKRNKTLTFYYKELKSSQTTVTVNHYDQSTGKTLLNETVIVAKNSVYTANPKPKGYFVNDAGKLYEPVSPYATKVNVGTGGVTVKIPYHISDDGVVDNGIVVTIKHVDNDTKKVLLTEKVSKPKNTTFQYPAKPTGYFYNKNGDPYVPVKDIVSITTGTANKTVEIPYTVNPPGEIDDDTGTGDYTPGKAKGVFSWELNKDSDTSDTKIILKNTASITGKHYETRNVKYSIKGEGINYNSSSPINETVSNPNKLKDESLTYSFSYEFTNYYKDHYKCGKYSYDEDGNSTGCARYDFDYRETLWNQGETATWSTSLILDHQYKELIELGVNDGDSVDLSVGRKATISGTGFKYSNQRETFDLNAGKTTVDTQEAIDYNEPIKYDSDLDNHLYVNLSNAYYYPANLDENLKPKYSNETSYNDFDYAIPLRIATQSSKQVDLALADDFYVTKNTGLQVSVPYEEDTKATVESDAKEIYEELYGTTYDDEVLYDKNKGSRYFLPIDGNDHQKKNTWYNDDFVVGKLGLSDVTIYAEQQLRFNKYLLGNAKDDPVFNEQQETPKSISYTNSFTIPKDNIGALKDIAKERSPLIHSFRSTDIQDKYLEIKGLVSGLQ